MIVTDFTHNNIQEALMLARFNYEEERRHVPELPDIGSFPDLTEFADNNLGVAAFNDGRMLGFLCFYEPLDNAFTTTARGTFSPIHAHGVVYENRKIIYKRLYQAASEKLVREGVTSHSVALYAHDTQAISSFFNYGFGLRCIDAIRPMKEIDCLSSYQGYLFCELDPDERNRLLPLKNLLREHLGKSPTFMYCPPETETELERTHNYRQSRYFCAFLGDVPIAFLEIMDRGENFVCDDSSMKNICGAFCLSEHRGKGVYQALLNYVIATLKGEGYTRLGVDFESFNPTAYGFWQKYFKSYTHSVVRRIDENIIKARG